MTAGRFIPAVWSSPSVPHLRSLELIAYLLVPWAIDLPWSLLVGLLLAGTAQHFGTALGQDLVGITVSFAVWYLVSFLPMLVAGVVYYRRDPEVSLDRALLFAHAMVVMNFLCYWCAWRALGRLVRGRTSWTKTDREPEAVDERAAVPAVR